MRRQIRLEISPKLRLTRFEHLGHRAQNRVEPRRRGCGEHGIQDVPGHQAVIGACINEDERLNARRVSYLAAGTAD